MKPLLIVPVAALAAYLNSVAATEWFMPIWAQILVYISIVAVAVGVIWKKILRPLATLIALLDDALPIQKELVKQFKDQPEAFKILKDIAGQFRTDSGSSLRDVVNRLEKSVGALETKAGKAEARADAVGADSAPGKAADAAARK